MKTIQIPSYIYGEERFAGEAFTRTVQDISGDPVLEVHDLNEWGVKGAGETAISVQPALDNIPVEDIFEVLKRTMNFYFTEDVTFKTVCKITGSPFSHVKDATQSVKEWCRDLLPYYRTGLGSAGISNTRIRNSAPVLAVLPGNSDQEVVFVLAQTLMAKNATIVRPSSSGAGAFAVYEFIKALNRALDSLDSQRLEPLRSAVCLMNTPGTAFLDTLCYDGWNYIFFGDRATIREITGTIRNRCFPRITLGYGAGLSTTVIFDDHNMDSHAGSIMDSITVNRGNECDATDILYIHDSVFDRVMDKLTKQAANYLSGDPFDMEKIGITDLSNADYIKGELIKRGKYNNLNMSRENALDLIHASLIPLNKFETALEYPGPVASVRSFGGLKELSYLIDKDLSDNSLEKNLVTSVYSSLESDFLRTIPVLKAHTVKWNKPSHTFNYEIPHQGIFLLRELVETMYLDH
ncbi:MAG: aldehyde dehydrogenase family protein [Desulfobacterales bacterium]|nr:aldehyde dehydrogenase family protein [Desulfobacterales bacterium]